MQKLSSCSINKWSPAFFNGPPVSKPTRERQGTTFSSVGQLSKGRKLYLGKPQQRLEITLCLHFDKKTDNSEESRNLFCSRKISAFSQKSREINKQPAHFEGSPRQRSFFFVIFRHFRHFVILEMLNKNAIRIVPTKQIQGQFLRTSFSSKERYRPLTSHKFEKAESSYPIQILQDGMAISFEKDSSRSGLHVQNRPRRFLFFSPPSSRFSKACKVQVGRPHLCL